MKEVQKVTVNNETVYLKKDFIGWHIVHPIKNEDGSINWKNLIAGGSWWKLGAVILFVIIALGAMSEFANLTDTANKCLAESQWARIQI